VKNKVKREFSKYKRSQRAEKLTSFLLAFSLLIPLFSVANTTPAKAACITGFPTIGWQAIRTTSGSALTDTTNEFTPYPAGGTADISSVNGSPMDWFSSGEGCDFFFRIRLKGDPRQGTGLDNNVYLLALGRSSTSIVWTGVNGDGNNKASEVYVYNPTTSTYISQISDNSNDGTNKIKVSANTVGGTTEYLLQWRVSNSLLPASVFTSPVGFFAGTSQSNVVTTINADCINSLQTSGSCTPTYTGTLAADLTVNTDSAVRPTINSVTPDKGPLSGGTSVTISGTNLTNASQVYFGGSTATINSSTNTSISVTVNSPAQSRVGLVDVQVVTPGGTSILSNAFTYYDSPAATTISASGISATRGSLNGTINANSDSTAVTFCYGTASNLSPCTTVTATPSPITGTTTTPVSYDLSALAEGTPIYYRVQGSNSGGTTNGSILSFTPANATLSITNTSLENGTIGKSYLVSLEPTGGSGVYSSWSLISGSLPDGLSLNTSTGVISGTPTTTASATSLTFRVTDSTSTSADKTLALTISAGLPGATTENASSIGATSATLNGTVAANGANTSITFCLANSGGVNAAGALTCASNPTASTTSTTSSATVTASLTGLTSGELYFFQIYGTNSAGTTYGKVLTFVPASAPSVTTSAASSISSTGATLNGSVTANGSSAAIYFCLATSNTTNGSGALNTCISNPTSNVLATLSSTSATASATSLTSSTTYYFQIYSTNSTGTTYGTVLNFTTPNTYSVSSVTASPTSGSATFGYGSAVSTTLTLTRAGDSGSDPTTTLSVTGGSWTVTSGSNVTTSSASLSSGNPVILTLSAASGTITLALATGANAGSYTASTNNSPTSLSYSVTIAQANQATLTAAQVTSTAAYTGTAYTATPSFSSTGGSGSGAVTYSIETGGTASTCALSNASASATLTATSVGTCLIKATKAADTNYNSATSANITFTFTVATQTITFGTLSNRALASGTFSVSATTTATGLSVSFSSTTTGTCTVLDTTVTLVAAGTCTINANQAGSSNYNAATTVSRSFVIDPTATYSATTLAEAAANDGSITETITITLSAGILFTYYEGTDLASGRVSNVPAGLTAVLRSGPDRTYATLSFTGTATAHANANDISNLTITFFDGDFTPNGVPSGANRANLSINFADPAYSVSSVTASPSSGSATVGYGSAVSTTLTLTRAGGSGSDPTTTLSVTGGTWTVSGGSNVTTSSSSLSSGSSVTLTLTASSGTITLALNTGASAGAYTASTTSTTPLNYSVTVSSASAATATYNVTTLAEAVANNGSISETLTVTLSNDTFSASDGTNLAARVTNVPSGLTAVLTIGSSRTVATLSFTGTANSHSNARDVSDLTITFLSTDFTLGALPTGANRSNLVIDFSGSVTVSTNNASDIRKDQAKLNGQANEALTDPKFCIKTSTFSTKSECSSSGTEIVATTTGSGSSVAMEKVATLNPSTTYYYIVHGVSTTGGEVTGEVRSFKTKPNVETKAPSSKTARSARLNATVSEALTNPRFCYKTTSFTSLADCLSGGSTGTAEVVSSPTSLIGSFKLPKKSAPQISFGYLLARKSSTPSGSVVPGTTYYALSVSSLNPSTTYYYIIYGTVDGSEYDGGVQTFATDSEDSGSSGGSSGSSGGSSGGTSSTPVVTPGPIISSISKSLVCFTGTEVTISGSYLDGGVVTLNGASAVIKNISGTSIRVSLPSSAAGRRTITVTTPYGSAVAYIDYVSAPKPKYEPIRIPYLAQGDSIYLPFAATGALSYSLTGKLPQGLSFNTSTGLISGVAIENGIFIFTMVAEGCGETSQLVELDIDAPTPNAISHRINFNRNSCTIPDAAKESLERFLEKAKGLSPRNIIPEIYVSGGGKASDPNDPLADCRQEAICDFLLLENLLGEVLSDVFTGSENRIEIIVYWPRPNDGN